jgi:gamma-glutamylcyclotransferase (GGCT)/AIG2-like uncharacterized protein YtfP
MQTQTNGQLFVYGTLRSGFHHPAYQYISRHFTLLNDLAKAKGRLYDLGTYPAAKPSNDEFYIVGELYRINHPDELSWAFAQLDDYEGINTEPGQIALYRREITTIYLSDHTTEAWVYWYNGDVSQHPALDTGDLLAYLQQKNK